MLYQVNVLLATAQYSDKLRQCVHFTPAFVALDHGKNAKAAEICWAKADGLNRVVQRFREFHQTCTFCEDREALR